MTEKYKSSVGSWSELSTITTEMSVAGVRNYS